MPQKQAYLGIDETAQVLNVSRQTIYNLIERGVLRRLKRPGDRRAFIPVEDVEKAKLYEEK